MIHIWLVWRTNVWKSTLFNKLLWTHRIIVTDISGTTREIISEETQVFGHRVLLSDSPWLEKMEEEAKFINEIIATSDIILFVLDWKQELWKRESQISEMIFAAWKKDKTLLLINKCDGKVYSKDIDMFLSEFYSLWFSDVIPLSAVQNEWFDEFWHLLSHKMSQHDDKMTEIRKDIQHIPLAIVWRPNVGKSTLINTFVGEDISEVKDEPWTTLDYIKAKINYEGEDIVIYDTAGIRKKWRIMWLEKIAYSKTVSMLKYIRPVTVLLLDLNEGVTHRDKTLLAEVIGLWIPIIVAVNKIDLFEPEETDQLMDTLLYKLWIEWIPVIKISWMEWKFLPKLLQKVKEVYKNRNFKAPTSELNKIIQKQRLLNPPKFPKNKICKRKYIAQVETDPTYFSLSVNNKQYANFSFKRWVEKSIRKAYWFEWIPINLKFSNKVESNPYTKKNESE